MVKRIFICIFLLTFIFIYFSCDQTKLNPNNSKIFKEIPQIQEVRKITILCFHNIDTDLDTGYTINPVTFENDIKILDQKGFKSITVKDLLYSIYFKSEIPKKSFVLTFDDGYEEMYTNVLPILKKYNLKATFFIPVNFIKEDEANRMKNTWDSPEQQNPPKTHMIWREVKALFEDGHEIASHGYNHKELNSKILSYETLNTEINESKNEIEKRLNTKVYSFSYPSGQYIDKTIEFLKKTEYLGAVTTKSEIVDLTNCDPFELPRFTIYDKTSINQIIEYLNFR
jgi:peptidoglycan/xylan/chitin deacetylase (PgdA/CDA1 family)